MAAVSLAVSLATLDTSMTNTALPSIAAELRVGASQVIGIVTIYQLIMVATMLPLAALASVIGHRRVFLGGLMVFLVASLWCGKASTLAELEAARGLQGLGAAALLGCNVALVRHIYPPEQLGRGMGLNTMIVALSLAGGPVLASALLTVTTWQWLFYINVPIGVIALLLSAKCLPAARALHRSFDMQSAALCALALGALVHGMDSLSNQRMDTFWAWPLAAACLLALLRRERQRPHPILPVDLFRLPVFRSSTITAVLMFTAQGAGLVALPFLLEQSFHRSIGEIGWLIAPWPVMGATMAPIAGRLSDRLPASWLGAAGLACFAVGLFCLAWLPATSHTLVIAACMALCGLGIGLFLSPNQRAVVASVPAHRSASASGMAGVARLFGQTTGAAMVAGCFAFNATHGASTALWMAAACALLGSALSAGHALRDGHGRN